MNVYAVLVDAYDRFLGYFAPQIQWLITLVIIIALVGAAIGLVRRNPLFVILLVIVLPFVLPVFGHFLTDIYGFFLYLIQTLGASAPTNP